MMAIPQNGLQPISHDRSRDWKHKRRFKQLLFGATSPSSLPLTLGRVRLPVEDQNITSLCTEFGTSKANGYRNDVDMSPDYQGALESEYAGAPILSGTDPKTAMNTAVLFGSLPKPLAPFTLAQDGEIKTTDWRQWPPALAAKATPYAPAGWFDVSDDAEDIFDSIRVALYDARGDSGVVMAFGNWYQEWSIAGNQKTANMPVPINPPVALHNYLFIDWMTAQDGTVSLVAQLSSGTEFGADGFLYFSREAINKAFANMINDGTGLYMFRSTGSRFASLVSIGYALLGRLQGLVAQLRA